MSTRVAICFLVINKMESLPELSIRSAFDRTNEDIFVGYLDETDLPILPKEVELKAIKLENSLGIPVEISDGKYSDFSQDAFYRIVQYKWLLLQKIFDLDYDIIIYSDTDVYWNLNPVSEIVDVFDLRPDVHIQIQSATNIASDTRLCMGFVAFRKSDISLEFVNECKARHTRFSQEIGPIGDDDIATKFYIESNYPKSIIELPQTTFPVGRMLKLYSSKSIFPGLSSPTPFIFHANYVVGLQNKVILLKLFVKRHSYFRDQVKLGTKAYLILLIKRARHLLNRCKVRVLHLLTQKSP